MTRNGTLAWLYGGLIAGTLDIFAPVLINSLAPVRVLQIIARGLFGKASYEMGATSATIGLLLQWAMSLFIAMIYVFAAQRLPALRRYWIAAGIAFGTVVFFVMEFVVVPLSNVAAVPKFTTYTFAANMIAMWIFGLIIAFFAQRFLGRAER